MLGLGTLARKVFGTPNDRKVKSVRPLVAQINALEPQFAALSDEDIIAKTAEFKERVRKLLVQYEDAFAGQLDTLPKPFAADPVTLKFVENPVPQSVPEPRWTLAQRQILTQWAEEGLKNGSLELSTSRWASRPHIVMKTPAHVHKDLEDVGKCKLRVCGDYRLANQQIVVRGYCTNIR